jgi:sugar lactone lactonase YvrE
MHRDAAMIPVVWGYTFLEAPRADDQGGLYFSDIIAGGVYRWSPEGSVETVIPKRRGVGGLALHADGGLVVSGRDVCHVRDGQSRQLLTVAGALGFNDLTTDAAGRVYVGSMRSGAMEVQDRVPSELWRIDAEGRGTEVCGGIAFPNGVGFAPDGRTLYLSNYSAAEVLMIDAETGTQLPFVRVQRGNPDGLAVDEKGGVLVALGDAGCVARFTPDGALDRTLDVPSRFVTSLCFGGIERRTLYVTTTDNTDDPGRGATVFQAPSDVPGLVPAAARI